MLSTALTLMLWSSTPALSEPPKNYLGANPMGFAGFLRLNIGSYELFYERILGKHHGVLVSFDFIHVHHVAGYLQSHQWTFGGGLTYRYYFDEGHGLFAGLRLGVRRGFGRYVEGTGSAVHDHGQGSGEDIQLVNAQYAAIPQVGYRFWRPGSKMSIATRLGLGYGPYDVRATNRADAHGEAVARFSRDLLAPLPLVIEAELSLSFAF